MCPVLLKSQRKLSFVDHTKWVGNLTRFNTEGEFAQKTGGFTTSFWRFRAKVPILVMAQVVPLNHLFIAIIQDLALKMSLYLLICSCRDRYSGERLLKA